MWRRQYIYFHIQADVPHPVYGHPDELCHPGSYPAPHNIADRHNKFLPISLYHLASSSPSATLYSVFRCSINSSLIASNLSVRHVWLKLPFAISYTFAFAKAFTFSLSSSLCTGFVYSLLAVTPFSARSSSCAFTWTRIASWPTSIALIRSSSWHSLLHLPPSLYSSR